MITKTRKQGNSIMLTVPKDFNVPNGVEVEEFVEPQKEFYDFSEDILSDIIAEGYDKDEILVEFKNRKNKMHSSFRDIAEDTLTNSKVMTKEELATEIGL